MVSISAPIVNTISQIPQLYKSFMTKKVHHLSFHSLLLLVLTSMLWLLHGYFIFDWSLIISSLITTIINLCLLGLYMMYNNKRK